MKPDKLTEEKTAPLRYIKISELRSENDGSTCLRPLGLCELGGCCDVCFYGPNHPARQDRKKTKSAADQNKLE